MPDLAMERAHLAKAERDLAEGEERIARQRELVERLRAAGQDTATAERLLASLQGSLESWEDHRDQIVRTIAEIDGGR